MRNKQIQIIPLILALLIILLICISCNPHSHDTSPALEPTAASSINTPIYTTQPTNILSTEESSSTTELHTISPIEHATPHPTISPTPKPMTDIKEPSPKTHASSNPSAKPTVKSTHIPIPKPDTA